MTTYRDCFEAAVCAAIDGVTVLTANTRSARAIQAAAEARLRLHRTAWSSPDVLPYGAFLARLYCDAVVAGEIGLRVLEREQELQLWRQIIERSPSGRELLLTDAAAALASESFRTACEYEIALDSSEMSASSDTRAFSGWATEFRRQLAAHGWTCPALYPRELSPCLSSLELPHQVLVLVAELVAEPTPAQRSFLDALAKAGVSVTLSLDDAAEDQGDDSELGSELGHKLGHELGHELGREFRYEFNCEADELHGAAQWARQQVESSPGARVGIVIFDLDRKLAQVESAFRGVLHPEHLLGQHGAEAFEIASPRPLADYPVVQCALGLLSLFAAPIDFDTFQATLHSPYLAAPPEAVARFLAGTRKQARRQVSFDDFAQWLHACAGNPLRDLPDLRAALQRLKLGQRPNHGAPGKPASGLLGLEQPPSCWAKIAREILQAFGWPGGVELNSEEFQCTKSWSELFASVASLEALDWRCDFLGFVERLKRAAAGRRFKPETLGAPVQIMDLAESEGSVFDALWIAGCSDERWPDWPRHSPLLPMVLLKSAGAPVAGTPQADECIARITRRLLQSAPRIALSLALRGDDEREQRWSPLFAGIGQKGESIVPGPSPAERFAPVDLEAIPDNLAPPLAESELVAGGVWLLQEQSNCPFRAFAVRRLLARELDGPNEAMAPTERGKVIERALQLIWEQLKDKDGLQRPDRAAIVLRAVEEAMASELPRSDDAWSVSFRELELRRNIDLIEMWLEIEAERKPFHVLGHQIEMDLELGGLSLRGRLDRLDEVGDAHVVIDYKTGAADSVSSWHVPRPRRPQLPFYALAMLQQDFDVSGVSFAAIRPGECGFRGLFREKDLLSGKNPAFHSAVALDGTGFDEYTALWAEELDRVAAGFVQGDAAVDPILPLAQNHSPCRHCHLPSLCRVSDAVGEELDGDPEEECDE